MHGRLLSGVLGTIAFAVACSQSDYGISTSVKSKLVADDTVKARNINVDTKNGVVTLTGAVQTPTEESRALQIARGTKGVAEVVDQLTIVPGSEPGAAATSGRDDSPAGAIGGAIADAVITSDVKARLLTDPDVSGLRIDVDTRDRIVTLTGAVSDSAQKSRAVEIARRADNVLRVEDNLMVAQRPGARTK